MSKFERECRYIVIKRKDLALVPVAYRRSLVEPLGSLMSHIPHREYVVVESDWPEYETVWGMIEARVTGQPSELEQLRTEAQALRDQVKALQSDANSYQSGYDEGRRMGTKHRQDEVEQLTREVAALRARVVVVPDWKPLTGPGQIKKGDLLRFAVAGKEIEAPAQLIINEGTGKEEIVYNRGKNHYFITSMAVDGTSSHKSVQVKSLNSKVVSEGDIFAAVQAVRARYPVEVFPADGASVDCRSAAMARVVCDAVTEALRALLGEGKEDGHEADQGAAR